MRPLNSISAIERAESSSTSGNAASDNIPLRTDQDPILIVAPQPFYQARGTPIALRYVLQALAELGYQVDVLTFPLGDSLDIPGIRLFRTSNPLRFRSIPVGFSFKKLFLDLLLMRLLRERLRKRRYLFVHAVEEAAFFSVLLCRPWRMYVVYDMASSLPAQLAQYSLFKGRLVQRIFRGLERWLLSNVGHVVCSAGLSNHVHSVTSRVRLQEWFFPTTIRSTAPAEIAALRDDLRIPRGSDVVLYTGTFAKYQGLSMLIDAIPHVVAQAPNTVFVLVGAKEEDFRAVQEAISPALANNVRLLPRQPRDRIDGLFALANILVSPRLHGANLPLKIFDYMGTGKPIVATDIPAHRALLDETRSLLSNPSPAALADAIMQLLSDRERAARLGAAAQAYAKEKLTWDKFVDSVAEICKEARAHAQAHSQCVRGRPWC